MDINTLRSNRELIRERRKNALKDLGELQRLVDNLMPPSPSTTARSMPTSARMQI
jgi:hypothetical protein